MSQYTNMTVFTVKKEPLNENTVNDSDVQNARNYLSNKRFSMKFGRFFMEILKSGYQKISLLSPY